jgi:hypothetical protein
LRIFKLSDWLELPATLIRQKALEHYEAGLTWHFHVMTPNCMFNEQPKYALLLETPTGTVVHYSDSAEPVTKLGKELAPLAHKADVLQRASAPKGYAPSPAVGQIIARAKELNAKQVEWHHHVTFAGCQFNKGGHKFTLVLEDPESGKTLESVSDEEPINDLRQIEPLFYSQQTAHEERTP